ncbi:MAG: hypothetical protein ACXADO_13020 [Candidatus Thorarchaeota archaeon]
MELRAIARYPFLDDASEFIRKEGPTLEELLQHPAYEEVRREGANRVRNALEKGLIPEREANTETDLLRDILSFPIARMIVSGVGDAYLIRRYSLAEAERARRNMTSTGNDFISYLASRLGMDFQMNGLVLIHFSDYLRYSVQMKSKDWKLVNQRLVDGYVRLGRDRFIRIVKEAIQRKMESELPLPVNDQILSALGGSSLRRRKRSTRWRTWVGSGSREYLPACGTSSELSSLESTSRIQGDLP